MCIPFKNMYLCILTHVCAVCVPDHAKSCVPTWAELTYSTFCCCCRCAPVSYCFSCWLRMSQLQPLWPSCFVVVNSWKNHKNKGKRIFECNCSSKRSATANILAPLLSSSLPLTYYLSIPFNLIYNHICYSCFLAEASDTDSNNNNMYNNSNTLSSSVFSSGSVLGSFLTSFNVLRTRSHWP